MAREHVRPHLPGDEVELVAKRTPERLLRSRRLVAAGRATCCVERRERCQDPPAVTAVVDQDRVERDRARLVGRFGRDQSLGDRQGELAIGMTDVPAEDLVTRRRPGRGRPDEARRDRWGRRPRGLEQLRERGQDGVPEPTDRPRGGPGRARLPAGRQSRARRRTVCAACTESSAAHRTARSSSSRRPATSSARRWPADSSPDPASAASADSRISGRGSRARTPSSTATPGDDIVVSMSRPSCVARASGLERRLRAAASSSAVASRSAIGTSSGRRWSASDERGSVGAVEEDPHPRPDDAHERRHDDRRGEGERQGVEHEDEHARDADRDRHPDPLDGGLDRQARALRERPGRSR